MKGHRDREGLDARSCWASEAIDIIFLGPSRRPMEGKRVVIGAKRTSDPETIGRRERI
jgi:hypothetical protein